MVKRKASEIEDKYVPPQDDLRKSKRTRKTATPLPGGPAQGPPTITNKNNTKKSGKKGTKKTPTTTKPRPVPDEGKKATKKTPTTTTKPKPASKEGKGKRKAGDDDNDDFEEQEKSLRRSKRLKRQTPTPAPQTPPRAPRARRRGPRTEVAPEAPVAPVAPVVPVRPRLAVDINAALVAQEQAEGEAKRAKQEKRWKLPFWWPSEDEEWADEDETPEDEALGDEISEEQTPPPAWGPMRVADLLARRFRPPPAVESRTAIDLQPPPRSGDADRGANSLPVRWDDEYSMIHPFCRETVNNWANDVAASTHHKELKPVCVSIENDHENLIGDYRFFTPHQVNSIYHNRGSNGTGDVSDHWSSSSGVLSHDSSEDRNQRRERFERQEINMAHGIEAAYREADVELRRDRESEITDREEQLRHDGYRPLEDAALSEREEDMDDFETDEIEAKLQQDGYNPPPVGTPFLIRQILYRAFGRHVMLLARQQRQNQEQPQEGTMQANLGQMLRGGEDLQDPIPWYRRRAIMFGRTPEEQITPEERRIIAINPGRFTVREMDVAIESREQFLRNGGHEHQLTQAEMLLEVWGHEEPPRTPSLTPSGGECWERGRTVSYFDAIDNRGQFLRDGSAEIDLERRAWSEPENRQPGIAALEQRASTI